MVTLIAETTYDEIYQIADDISRAAVHSASAITIAIGCAVPGRVGRMSCCCDSEAQAQMRDAQPNRAQTMGGGECKVQQLRDG